MAHPRKKAIKETMEEKGTDTDPDFLSILPGDLLRYFLFPLLASSAGAQLAQTSRLFRGLPESKEATIAFGRNLRQLLSFVALGNKRKAEALILQYPELLFAEGQAGDYSDYYCDGQYYQRKLQGTALQMALGAEDVNLYAMDGTLLEEGMVEMIQRHLKKLPNGETIIAEQTQKQFPAGWEAHEEKEHERHLSALREVREVIEASADNKEKCQAAIRKFKDALAPPEIITTGKHWDAKLLLAALTMGEEEYFYHRPADDLFYEAVVGYIQTLAPANYAMAQARGLKDLLVDGANFTRDLKYHCSDCYYYPISNLTGLQLGFNAWVDGVSGALIGGGGRRWGMGAHVKPARVFFQSYLEAKTTVLRQLIPQPEVHTSPSFRWCVVM